MVQYAKGLYILGSKGGRGRRRIPPRSGSIHGLRQEQDSSPYLKDSGRLLASKRGLKKLPPDLAKVSLGLHPVLWARDKPRIGRGRHLNPIKGPFPKAPGSTGRDPRCQGNRAWAKDERENGTVAREIVETVCERQARDVVPPPRRHASPPPPPRMQGLGLGPVWKGWIQRDPEAFSAPIWISFEPDTACPETV